MAQNMNDVTMVTSGASGPIASKDLTALCAAGFDCTHLLRERRGAEVTDLQAVASAATWRFAMIDEPAAFGALPVTGRPVRQNEQFAMTPWVTLVADDVQATGDGYVFVSSVPSRLPAGLKAVPAREWAATMTPAVQYHGDGTGVAGILPFFSVLIVMGAAFVATNSFLLDLGYAHENARLRRLGLGTATLLITKVTHTLLPWAVSMRSVPWSSSRSADTSWPRCVPPG